MTIPHKYLPLVEDLKENTRYTAALITSLAEERGLLAGYLKKGETDLQLVKQRVRISFNRLRGVRRFPMDGDGSVSIPGQAPTPGWYGWRWKEALCYRPIPLAEWVSCHAFEAKGKTVRVVGLSGEHLFVTIVSGLRTGECKAAAQALCKVLNWVFANPYLAPNLTVSLMDIGGPYLPKEVRLTEKGIGPLKP